MAQPKAGVDVQLGIVSPQDAIARFQQKDLLLPSFRWQDIWQQEHARGVASSGVMRYDVLQLVSDELGISLAQSTSGDAFVTSLREKLIAKGFWGDVTVTEPVTKERRVTEFNDARLRLIHNVNLRQAHNAGNWDKAQKNKKYFPFLRYVTMRDEKVREQHRAWDGVVAEVDDPWWDTHMPMNGWQCRCQIELLSARQVDKLRAAGKRVKPPPNDPLVTWADPRDPSRTLSVPRGVDPAFAYNVGKAPLRGVVPQPLLVEPYELKSPTATGLQPTPAMPFPRQRGAHLVLPEGVSGQEAVQAFLSEFGAAIGRPAVFTDAQGIDLVIDEELFKVTGSGEWKIKRGRERYVRLLAQAIKDPDEIWHFIEQRGDARRRYLVRFEIEGQVQPMVAVFEINDAGWVGITTFQGDLTTNMHTTLRKIRIGTRVFVRGGQQK